MPLLEVHGLVKRFGRRTVVNGVSFAVAAGEVVGLLGPNGAGKTTSFRMATGQIPPNGGAVVFNGEDVTGLPMYQRARRGMGYLSQEPSVFRKLTVEANLTAILEALPRSRSLGRRLTKQERRDRTDEALARFKLDHVRRNVAGKCSGGEKRRLEIARCLVCEPLLILLDEPFAAVDPVTTEDIRRIIRDLADAGIGILITDHNVREVFRTADRAYLISDGKVVTQGTPHELVNDQTAIDAYLGRSFEEDGFTRHFAGRTTVSVSGSGEVPAVAPAARIDRTGPGPAPAKAAGPKTPPPGPLPGSGKGDRTAAPAPAARPATEDERTSTPVLSPLPGSGRGLGGGVPPTPPPYVPPLEFPQPAASPFAEPTTVPPPARPEPAPPAGFRGAVAGLLGAELVRRAVEGLADDATVKASTVEVVGKGPAAVGPLLDALERRDPVLRRRAFEVLKFVAKEHAPLAYDPDAPDDLRLRQVAHLRAKIGRPDPPPDPPYEKPREPIMTPADLADAYLKGAADLRAAVAVLTREQVLARPVPGKWSTLEVLCHLADFEPVFADRMKRIVALGDAPLLLSADETLFHKELRYHDRDADEELAVVEATRRQMARILRGLTADQLQKTGVHSVRGLLTLEKVIQTATNHVNHHLPFIIEKRKALGV